MEANEFDSSRNPQVPEFTVECQEFVDGDFHWIIAYEVEDGNNARKLAKGLKREGYPARVKNSKGEVISTHIPRM